jgi:hypothetical protein
MNMRSGLLSGQTVLITGASSGIGAALARACAAEDASLVLTARNEQRLSELAADLGTLGAGQVRKIAFDLAQPGGAALLVDQLARDAQTVDILVNNAGAGKSGPVIGSTTAGNSGMIELNIVALTELSRAFAEQMVRRGRGQILNVASTGAYQPGPYTAVYYASKAYVHSFTLALAKELAGTGVSVSLLCPGATATEFSSRAGKADLELAMPAATVAQAALHGLLKHQRLIIPGWSNRVTIVLSKLLPGHWLAAVVAHIQKPLLRQPH